MRNLFYGTSAAFFGALLRPNIHKNHHKKPLLHAFTLAELLTAVLIISVIMVALAPVITKRMKDSISIETDRKKGEEIWTNPGAYTFQVPVGINILEISGAGGGGGGAGAVSKNYSKNYQGAGTRTITVPKGVSQITFALVGAGGGGGGANAKTGNDPCKFPLTIPSAADSGKDLCVSNMEPAEGYSIYFDVINNPATRSNREQACWRAIDGATATIGNCSETSWPSASPYFGGGGCRKTLCTAEGAYNFCNRVSEWNGEDFVGGVAYRLMSQNEVKLLYTNGLNSNHKWIFGQGLDLAMHKYWGSEVVGNRYTQGNEALGCQSPITSVCQPHCFHLSDGVGCLFDADYWGSNGGKKPSYEAIGITFFDSSNSRSGQVRCVRELNNWYAYSGAGGATGAKLTKTINVQPGDKLIFTIGKGGSGGSKGGGTGAQGGSTCLEHKRNGAHYQDSEIPENNGYYCAYGGYGGGGGTTSANGKPNATLAACTHTSGCTKSINAQETTSTYQGGQGAGEGGGAGATPDLGENNTPGLGFNATGTSSGGGGGFCQRGNRTPSNCQKGGSGSDGNFTISFDQFASGGGGGGAGAAGTSQTGDYKPIKIKVSGGETIVFTIGAGGLGGQIATNGENGQDTVIATKNNPEIFTFKGGLGGKTGTFNSSCTYDTLGCAKGGLGGSGGKRPNPALTPGSYVYEAVANEINGGSGGGDTKGFFGGMGGATALINTGSCGGYVTNDDNTCAKYDPDGNSGAKHNPITNLLGGQGGGGGGTDGKEGGLGGSGGNGFVRIKWDEANNE